MSFNEAYRGTPSWDTIGPKSFVTRLEKGNKLKGKILDVGCGTGENVLYLKSKGYDISGVDLSRNAIEKARYKASQLELDVEFNIGNLLKPNNLDKYDTIIDSAVFHVFNNADRVTYANNIMSMLNPGGFYFVQTFSDKEPGNWGPRRIKKEEFMQVFYKWKIESIDDSIYEINMKDKSFVQGYLATITNT